MNKSRDYYRILGVRPDATQAEIKEAWIFGVKAFHPDKFAGSSQRQQAVAQERTKAVNEAYYILSNSTRRANYDREYARRTNAENTPPPPRATPPPEPTKTASSADTSAKDNSTQRTQRTHSSPEQKGNQPWPALAYGAALYIPWLIAAAMLVSAAVEKHPYSFYMLLRWVCCAVFAWSAFIVHEKNRPLWLWVFGSLAALYNPIVLVHLNRSTWINVNWFTVSVIIVAAIAFLPRRAQIWTAAALTLVVVIGSVLWGVIRAQPRISSTTPKVIDSASAIDFQPESSPSIPRAIPRAIAVAPATITSGTASDSHPSNTFDQFYAPPSNISTDLIDLAQREEEEKAIHAPIDYQRGKWTTATGKAFAVAKFFERNLGDRTADLDALADQLGAQKHYTLIEKQKRGGVWWVRVFLYKR